MTDANATTLPTIRLDKWLWHARFFKSRSLSAGMVNAGKVRVDGRPVSKPARAVGPGNVLTFHQEKNLRIVKILDCGTRRGPAPEAVALYDDMSPEPVKAPPKNPKYEGKGRPTGKDRRDMASRGVPDGPFPLE